MAEPRHPGYCPDECVFAVVGEHREDPDLLLLRGTDDRFYQLDPLDGLPIPVDFADCWRLDPDRAGTPPSRSQWQR
jgi:hypothetical protein